MPLTPRERAAWHEAGHVVAALEQNIRVRRVTIVPNETSLGHTSVRYPRWWRHTPNEEITPHREGVIVRFAVMKLAGHVAECRVSRRHNWRGARTDMAQAGGVHDLIEQLGGWDDGTHGAAFTYLWRRTEMLLARPEVWCQVEAVAAALLARGTLRTDDIQQVIVTALDGWIDRDVACRQD
jgi:hypothetical protein